MTTEYTTIPLRGHGHTTVADGTQLDHGTAHVTASLADDDHVQYVEETPQDNTAETFALLTLFG